MSIINEALRKAGKESTISLTPKPKLEPLATPGNLGITTERRSSKVNWGPLFVISVLVLITGPIIAPVFSTPFRKDIAPSSLTPSTLSHAPALPAMNTRQAQFGIEEAPRLGSTGPAAMPPTMLLSGIVFSPENSYCILNDRVVKVGEKIDGAKLIAIQNNGVTVEFEGQTLTIPVS